MNGEELKTKIHRFLELSQDDSTRATALEILIQLHTDGHINDDAFSYYKENHGYDPKGKEITDLYVNHMLTSCV